MAKQGRVRLGFPEAFVDAALSLLAEAIGHPHLVTNEVEKALGRPARTFAEWAASRASAFKNGRDEA